ncbi:hypothetical protein C8F01DRAFT_1085676 [Mycena amicta]|nr:hypothetical protein C8F01DRAFT_1085676 [Mycena amicta]
MCLLMSAYCHTGHFGDIYVSPTPDMVVHANGWHVLVDEALRTRSGTIRSTGLKFKRLSDLETLAGGIKPWTLKDLKVSPKLNLLETSDTAGVLLPPRNGWMYPACYIIRPYGGKGLWLVDKNWVLPATSVYNRPKGKRRPPAKNELSIYFLFAKSPGRFGLWFQRTSNSGRIGHNDYYSNDSFSRGGSGPPRVRLASSGYGGVRYSGPPASAAACQWQIAMPAPIFHPQHFFGAPGVRDWQRFSDVERGVIWSQAFIDTGARNAPGRALVHLARDYPGASAIHS